MGEPEEKLVERAKENPEAFSVLYERYVDQIYQYIFYRTGNRYDAEDLTAKTFYRALANLKRYRYRGLPFSAWLYRIAHNHVVDYSLVLWSARRAACGVGRTFRDTT